MAAYRERLAARGIGLETALPERSAIVCADPDRLRQLFGNLIENTLRYTDAGGRVQFRCRVEPDAVAIDVLDSAPGVAPEMLPRLFDRFFRAEESRNRQSGGAGLGLAISRNIVEAHDGYGVMVDDPEQLLPALQRALKGVKEEKRQAVLNVICGSH